MLGVLRHLAGQAVGQVVLLVVRGQVLLALLVQRGQLGVAVLAGGLRLLPGVVQGRQHLRGFTDAQALQLGCGGVQRGGGFAVACLCRLLVLRALGQVEMPLALHQGGLVRGLHVGQLGGPAVHVGVHGGALFVAQQFHTVSAGLELVELLFGRTGLFKHLARDVAVNLGAGQFLQQLGAVVGAGVQKGGKTALGQQHGLGEAGKVQARNGGHAPELVHALAAQNGAFAGGPVHTGQLHFGRLQRAVHLVTRAALAPEGAVHRAFHLKLHLGQAVHRVARHDVVGGCRDAFQARGLVVQRQANGVQQGRFARAGGAGDGKQAVVGKGRLGEVNAPLPFE